MERFNEFELEVTKELLNIALANSADAYSKMANERILFKGYEMSLLKSDELSTLLHGFDDEQLYVLTTEIKGKMEGICYLVFNKEDAMQAFRTFAPGQENIAENGELGEFQQAILMELDNILSAAMVTQLSNILELFVYGDVPNYKLLNQKDFLKIIQKDHELYYKVAMNIKTRLESNKTKISPYFIWLFKEDFVDAVKSIVDKKKEGVLLRKS